MRALALLILLLGAPAHAMHMVGFGAAGGSCTTQSASVSQTSTNNEYETWLSGGSQQTRGQSFTVSGTIELYSIIITGNVSTGGSGNATLRLGESSNLTSGYTQVGPVAYSSATPIEYEFVFSEPRPTLYASTTYYFGISTDATAVGNALYIAKQDSDIYANGSVWLPTLTQWDMETETTTRDLWFKVMKCD